MEAVTAGLVTIGVPLAAQFATSWVGKTLEVKVPNYIFDKTISSAANTGSRVLGGAFSYIPGGEVVGSTLGSGLGCMVGGLAAPFTATSGTTRNIIEGLTVVAGLGASYVAGRRIQAQTPSQDLTEKNRALEEKNRQLEEKLAELNTKNKEYLVS